MRRRDALAVGAVLALASVGVAWALLRASNLRACETTMRVVVDAGFGPDDTVTALSPSWHAIYSREQSGDLLRGASRWGGKADLLRARVRESSVTQVLVGDGMSYVVFYDSSGKAKDFVCIAQ